MGCFCVDSVFTLSNTRDGLLTLGLYCSIASFSFFPVVPGERR